MIFSPRSTFATSLLGLAMISGCSSPYSWFQNQSFTAHAKPDVVAVCGSTSTPCALPSRPIAVSPLKLLAVGYGSAGNYPQYTLGQQKLMAMRAAQVDAYRNLAEQVQGFRISGSTTVSAFAIQNDSIRTYVDSFIRGARVVSINAIADGNFQANVELDVNDQFVDCVVSTVHCAIPYSATGCATAGCTAPSASYYSY